MPEAFSGLVFFQSPLSASPRVYNPEVVLRKFSCAFYSSDQFRHRTAEYKPI